MVLRREIRLLLGTEAASEGLNLQRLGTLINLDLPWNPTRIPDVLEDVWIDVALGKVEHGKQTINALPEQHPFEIKYDRIEKTPWESCTKVLDNGSRKEALMKGW